MTSYLQSQQPFHHQNFRQASTVARLLFPGGRTTICTLPDNVLLEIFTFYLDGARLIEAWLMLVHVCCIWRQVVFASPRHLNLRLLCTGRIPMMKTLDVWPDLPIVIRGSYNLTSNGMDNVISALGHSDRICEILFEGVPSSLKENFAIATVTQISFPALTRLMVWSFDARVPILPDSFLGGFTPRLQEIHLEGIPFPALPDLLLHTGELIKLRLKDIPHHGYIAPKAMVTALSPLTNLASLTLEFRSPLSHPYREPQGPPLPTRTVLPALTHFWFKGVSEYLEEFMAQTNPPIFHFFKITFFNQFLFITPQVFKYISHTEHLSSPHIAKVVFYRHSARVKLPAQSTAFFHRGLDLGISCTAPDWQLSSLAEVCSSSLLSLSTVERLYIREEQFRPPHFHDDTESTQWRELLHPFTAVKDLYLSKGIALRVLCAMQELDGETAAHVLPMLQVLHVEGLQSREPVQDAIGQFVTMRQLSSHSIIVRPSAHSCVSAQ